MSAAQQFDPDELSELTRAADAAAAHSALLSSLDAALIRAFDEIGKIPRIEELYRSAGIIGAGYSPQQGPSGLVVAAEPDASVLEAQASYGVLERRHLYALGRAWAGDGDALLRFASPSVGQQWADIQDEIGTVGTRVVDGRISVELNPKMRPTLARGRNSLPGEYQELRRVDVQTYRQVNEVSSLICGASIDPVVLDGGAELRAVVERADRMIQHAMGRRWREDVSSFLYCGFATSEFVWETKADGFVGIHAARFRDQSSVDRWFFDERGSDLVGAHFEGWSVDRYHSFVLPRGQTPDSARLGLVNIAAVGNDIEGIPPTRPCTGLDKLSRLILQGYGISYQRFAIPLIKVGIALLEELTKILPMFGGAPTQGDIQKVVDRLNNLRTRAPGVLPMPPGIDVDFLQLNRDMPDPLPMLRYLDELKAVAWTNEASTLGRSNYGSYAMADASDAKYMRAAPHFMQPMIHAYDEVLQHMVLWNYPDAESLDRLPHYTFRFAGAQNASQWLTDARETIAAQPWTWPEPMRRMAAQLLTLPPEAFDTAASAAAAVEERAPVVDEASTVPTGDSV